MALKLVRKPNSSSTQRTSKENIVEAALRCFKQYGPQRTSMADIAEEAGVSRKTLYRVFEDRTALIEHILYQRLMRLSKKLSNVFDKFDNLEEALVEASIIFVAAARRDKLFHEIVQKDTNQRVEQYLLQPRDKVKKAMVAGWSPIVNKARGDGLVRDNLTNERIVEILASVHSLLLIRDDYSKADQKALLQDILVPAVMKD